MLQFKLAVVLISEWYKVNNKNKNFKNSSSIQTIKTYTSSKKKLSSKYR